MDTSTRSQERVRRLTTRVPRAVRSPGAAREFVAAGLRSWSVPEELVFDVVLVTSELVTNAIEHSLSEVAVELELVRDRLILRVRDAAAQAPVRRHAPTLAARSRGLAIVERLSHTWGYQRLAGGKSVWAEFGISRSDAR